MARTRWQIVVGDNGHNLARASKLGSPDYKIAPDFPGLQMMDEDYQYSRWEGRSGFLQTIYF